jgi:hypothetical protein
VKGRASTAGRTAQRGESLSEQERGGASSWSGWVRFESSRGWQGLLLLSSDPDLLRTTTPPFPAALRYVSRTDF